MPLTYAQGLTAGKASQIITVLNAGVTALQAAVAANAQLSSLQLTFAAGSQQVNLSIFLSAAETASLCNNLITQMNALNAGNLATLQALP